MGGAVTGGARAETSCPPFSRTKQHQHKATKNQPRNTNTRPSKTNHETRQDCGEVKSAAKDHAPPTNQKAHINCKTKPIREAFPLTPATNSGPIRAHQPSHLVLCAGAYGPLGERTGGGAARPPSASRTTARRPPGGRGLSLLYREGLGLLVDTPRLLALMRKREIRGRARAQKGAFKNGPAVETNTAVRGVHTNKASNRHSRYETIEYKGFLGEDGWNVIQNRRISWVVENLQRSSKRERSRFSQRERERKRERASERERSRTSHRKACVKALVNMNTSGHRQSIRASTPIAHESTVQVVSPLALTDGTYLRGPLVFSEPALLLAVILLLLALAVVEVFVELVRLVWCMCACAVQARFCVFAVGGTVRDREASRRVVRTSFYDSGMRCS